MARKCSVKVECVDDAVDKVCSIEDQLLQVHSSTYDYLYVKETFDWLDYETTDWQVSGNQYILVIPISEHGCAEPYLDSMVIKVSNSNVKYYPNIPVWHALVNDSIVIESDDPLKCKVLIKGER